MASKPLTRKELQEQYEKAWANPPSPDCVLISLRTLRQWAENNQGRKIRKDVLKFIETTKDLSDNRQVYIAERALIIE